MIKSFLKNSVVQNAGWLMFGKIAQMVISLLVGIITARYLGPSNYGILNYAGAYAAFFMAFCTLGTKAILVKEFVDNPDEEGEIIGSTLFMRGISSILSAIVIVLIVSVVDAGEKTTIIVTALYSLGLIFNIFETINYWFQSRLESKVTAIVSVVAYAITALYKAVLLILKKSVEWFAFANALDYACIGILLLILYKKHGGHRLNISIKTSKRIFSQSKHFILTSLMVSIYAYTDKLMLKQMVSDNAVGYYSTAVGVSGMWCFVLQAIIDSFYPSIIESYNKDYASFEKRNRQLYTIIFYISILVSVVMFIFGGVIINILYGEEFAPAVRPLRIVTWYTAFSYFGVARNAWIVCEKKQKYLKYIYIAAALSNVLLNLALIPLWGTEGAAVASLVTQVLTTMVIPFFIKPLKRNSYLMIEGILLKDIR